MSPVQSWLEVTTSGAVTKARFTTPTLLDDRVIAEVGAELYGRAATPGVQLLLDFSEVAQVASSLLAKVIELNRRVNAAGGRLALCAIHPDVYDLFEITRLNRIISIYPTEAEAMRGFAPPS